MMESNIFLFKKSCRWLQLWPSSFNVSLAWFLKPFGLKVRISNLPKVQQITVRKFLRNRAEMESTDFFMNQTLDNRVAKDTYIRSNVTPILRNNCYIDKVYLK